MADSALVSQLKFRVTSLESQLADKQSQIEQYQTVQAEADGKIKALSKMHADKVKNLLNSIQILKKEKASIEGLSKEHKRSKLIEQLNKQINDQDLVIEVLRKIIYDDKGKEDGRNICDKNIVKALTKGPDRIRPLTREELRIQIDRLKSINIHLENKFKTGSNKNKQLKNRNVDEISQVSSMSGDSFINHNEEILKRMKDIQLQNENMKLETNSKLKIIEKLKLQLKEKDKLKAQLEINKNEIDIANQKVRTYQRMMKDLKQNTNAKIIELYEREVKVQELEMISKENTDKLRQAQQSHNIFIQQIRLEKEQLEAQVESLKSENEQLIFENIATKKRLEEMKKILKEMGDINDKQKDEIKSKLIQAEENISAIVAENNKLKEGYKNIQISLFQERANWVEEKTKLLDELADVREHESSKNLIGKYMQDIADLREQNDNLRQMLEGGTGTGGGADDKILLQRLENYERKLNFYEKGDKKSESTYYDQLFKKYDELAQQFQEYKMKYGQKSKRRQTLRKQYIEISKKEEQALDSMTSGISKLGLEEVDSDILDNYNSDYDYELVINEWGEEIRMPKITEADKELLKLITSDLWNFVKEDRIGEKIREGEESYLKEDEQVVDMEKLRMIKNMSNPRGKKIVMYQEEIEKLEQVSQSVSLTSAMEKQLDKFDSDVNIDMRRGLGLDKVNDVSMEISGDLSMGSSLKEGDSNINKKKKKKVQEKGSRLKKNENLDDFKSSLGSSALNSDVSSLGINESQLDKMDSDIEGKIFKKKK